jgi:hypothetical protein
MWLQTRIQPTMLMFSYFPSCLLHAHPWRRWCLQILTPWMDDLIKTQVNPIELLGTQEDPHPAGLFTSSASQIYSEMVGSTPTMGDLVQAFKDRVDCLDGAGQ